MILCWDVESYLNKRTLNRWKKIKYPTKVKRCLCSGGETTLHIYWNSQAVIYTADISIFNQHDLLQLQQLYWISEGSFIICKSVNSTVNVTFHQALAQSQDLGQTCWKCKTLVSTRDANRCWVTHHWLLTLTELFHLSKNKKRATFACQAKPRRGKKRNIHPFKMSNSGTI